jgi:hypothetical protein
VGSHAVCAMDGRMELVLVRRAVVRRVHESTMGFTYAFLSCAANGEAGGPLSLGQKLKRGLLCRAVFLCPQELGLGLKIVCLFVLIHTKIWCSRFLKYLKTVF